LDDGEIEEEQGNFLKAFESYQLEDMADNASSDLSDEEDDQDNDDEMQVENIESIPLPELTRRQRKIRQGFARTALNSYYRENWRGSSISSMLYTIGLSMSKVTNDILWCGIVGTTSQYLTNEIDFERYALEIEAFHAEWSRLNTSTMLPDDTPFQSTRESFESTDATGRIPIDIDAVASDPSRTMSFEHSSNILLTRQGLEKFKDGRIFREDEYRFMLLRHWNLYESMMYTPFSATKLRIWSERGKQRLDTLLSKMG
jgi:cell division control protein 45